MPREAKLSAPKPAQGTPICWVSNKSSDCPSRTSESLRQRIEPALRTPRVLWSFSQSVAGHCEGRGSKPTWVCSRRVLNPDVRPMARVRKAHGPRGLFRDEVRHHTLDPPARPPDRVRSGRFRGRPTPRRERRNRGGHRGGPRRGSRKEDRGRPIRLSLASTRRSREPRGISGCNTSTLRTSRRTRSATATCGSMRASRPSAGWAKIRA